jgi:hypothetical protein
MGPGVHSLVASYRGDDNYDSARSEARSLTVGPDATTTVVTPSAASLSVSQEDGTQISYTITPATAIPGVTPTGRVSIAAGGPSGLFPICSQQISGTTGSCALTAGGKLPPGAYQVSAFYFGDAAFGSSRSDEQTFTITPDPPAAVPTSTTLALSAAKVTFGHEQAERLSVRVNPQSGGGTPAGRIDQRLHHHPQRRHGQLRPGRHHAAARQVPAHRQLRGQYGLPGLRVDPAGANRCGRADGHDDAAVRRQVRVGHEQSEHLSVQVNPQFSGTPTGKVTVRAGSVKICVITLKNGRGTCTLKARQLRAGTYHLAASYAAAALYAASTSARKTLTITR